MEFKFSGLSQKRAESRIRMYGYNLLPKKPPPSVFELF